jgi:hypothetical protein
MQLQIICNNFVRLTRTRRAQDGLFRELTQADVQSRKSMMTLGK